MRFVYYKNACSTCACVSRLPVTGSSVRIFQIGTCVLLLYPYHNIIWVAAELYDHRSPYAPRDTLLYADIVILLLLLSLYRVRCTRIGRPLRLGPTRQVGLPSSSKCVHIYFIISFHRFSFLYVKLGDRCSSFSLSNMHHNHWRN